eukprot:5957508-Pyramimonas_sp.AAC.1
MERYNEKTNSASLETSLQPSRPNESSPKTPATPSPTQNKILETLELEAPAGPAGAECHRMHHFVRQLLRETMRCEKCTARRNSDSTIIPIGRRRERVGGWRL